MKTGPSRNIQSRSIHTIATILLGIALLLFTGQSYSQWASKGFAIDPGGTTMQGTYPYFVGTVWGVPEDGDNFAAIWDYLGNLKWSASFSGTVGSTDYFTGSAVYFNGSIYVFVPILSSSSSACAVYVLDPTTWTQKSYFRFNLPAIDGIFGLKNNVAAVVADGQIFLFFTGSRFGTPVVYSSSDGLNYGLVSASNAPNYRVVHDAIGFIDPKDGKTRIMVVVSQASLVNGKPLLPAVAIFDPATSTFGEASPMPQQSLPDNSYGMYAAAWFGSWRTALYSDFSSCRSTYWNSGNTDAYLHVLGVVSTAQ